jgi:DNA-directed RNA polymerase subunit RPC12/RpoP
MGYPPRQRWALALSGVLTEMNKAHHHELGGWGKNEHTRNWCTNTLKDFYGVTSQAEHADMVEYLWSEGHTASARAMLGEAGDTYKHELVRRNRAEIERAGLLAWDVGRLVAVMGWGVWAEYVKEDEAWPRLLAAAYRCQQAYGSWRAFGEAYELGRLFWSGGKQHDGTGKALEALNTKADSPWRTLEWGLDLGVAISQPARARYKRATCAHCGGQKARPSLTAYVYCDFCGELCDFDFMKACEAGAQRPGPAYEQLSAQVAPELAAARARGDRAGYAAVQERLFAAFVAACPKSVSPRAGDPAYLRAYCAYMAEAATLAAFDDEAARLDRAMHDAVARIQFVQVGGQHKVVPQTFGPMLEAVLARLTRTDALYTHAGTYTRHPDAAPPELQRKIDASLFAQGWLPYLDEAGARGLTERLRLDGDYAVAEPGPSTTIPCQRCGAGLAVVAGARRVVCEHCGHRLELAIAPR